MNKSFGFKCFSAVLGGLLIYGILILLLMHFEAQVDGSSIKSVSDAIWYSIVTLTTVGYGDLYPISSKGKLIGYIFVISSLGVLGYLIGKINSLISGIRESKYLGYRGTDFKKHIVIIGWNQFAGAITQELVNANICVAIVTDNIADLE